MKEGGQPERATLPIVTTAGRLIVASLGILSLIVVVSGAYYKAEFVQIVHKEIAAIRADAVIPHAKALESVSRTEWEIKHKELEADDKRLYEAIGRLTTQQLDMDGRLRALEREMQIQQRRR